MKYLLFLITLLFGFQTMAQTKKIANASHASAGPTFNWSTSDNLGAIMDYDKFEKINVPKPGPPKLDTFIVDTIIKPDTAVYEKVSENNTLVIEEAHTVKIQREKEMKSTSSSKTRTNKSRKTKKKRLFRKKQKEVSQELNVKAEVRQSVTQEQPVQEAGIKWLTILMLIPIGLLITKKP